VRPVLLPAIERLGRHALQRRGALSRWVETRQGKLHVYDARGSGELPTVVLLHGLSSSATGFGPVLGRLLRHVRRVVVPDYPGHGFSGKTGRLTPEELHASIHAALGALDVGPAILVGNSLGGAVAMQRAIDHPSLVRALVLVSPAGSRSSPEEWDELRRTFQFRTRAEARRFMDKIYFRTPWVFNLFAHEMPAAVARPAVRELLEAASNDELPRPEELEALPMPVLLLWGQRERLLPDSHLAYLTRHLPRQTIIERPATYAHCPHFDHPGDLVRRIVGLARTL
jgi:pimeloyl-ACP methyl ester carboxylesterase